MRIWPASLSAKGPIQINWRACGRSAGCIDNAGRIVPPPAYRFLLVQFKTNKLCIGENLIILIES